MQTKSIEWETIRNYLYTEVLYFKLFTSKLSAQISVWAVFIRYDKNEQYERGCRRWMKRKKETANWVSPKEKIK